MRLNFAALFALISLLGACKSYSPSHIAEFEIPMKDYPQLIAELDALTKPFGLKRFAAAAGLNELHGREVLFFAYDDPNKTSQRRVLTVSDINGPGKVWVRVYEGGLDDSAQRTKFISEATRILLSFGGTLEARVPKE